MIRRAVIRATGHYLPERVVPNSHFEATLDTTDAWIRERTGIEERRFAAEGELTSHLAIRAAEDVLARAGLRPDDVDAVVVATSTPDLTFPAVATMVQAGIGMTRGFAYDVQAVCAGFIFGLANGEMLIRTGMADRVLVIGAETFSRIMDWTDRGTSILFGDGAGAVLLEASEGAGTSDDRGILGVDLNSDGRMRDILYVDGGVSSTGTAGKLRMQGNAVFRQAVSLLAATADAALERAGLGHGDLDWLVPHQANLRIIAATAQKLQLPLDRVVLTVQKHGNTSAASIPLALAIADAEGRFKPGDLVLMEGIGGGMAWGAVALRW